MDRIPFNTKLIIIRTYNMGIPYGWKTFQSFGFETSLPFLIFEIKDIVLAPVKCPTSTNFSVAFLPLKSVKISSPPG